jgi:hypothetical protein
VEVDILVRIGTFVLGAFGAWKVLLEILNGRQGRLREEYKFAREFFSDLDRMPQMHPFLKNKGLQAIAGDTRLNAAEVEYLLTLNDPATALRNYVLGRQYLRHFVTATGGQLDFDVKYARRWSRWWRKAGYLALYFLCYSLGSSPLILPSFKMISPGSMFLAFPVTAVIFYSAGYFALKAGIRIARAEALVKNQNRHSQSLVIARTRL